MVGADEIVIDGLGDTNHGDVEVAAGNLFTDGRRGLHGAVATNDVEDVDVHAFEGVNDLFRALRATGRTEDSATEGVDLGDVAGGEFHDIVVVFGDEALKAVTDAKDGAHAVTVIGFQDDGADNVVQAGAEAATGNDSGLGLAGVVIDMGAGAGLFEEEGSVEPLGVFAGVFHIEVEGNRGIGHVGADGGILDLRLAHVHNVGIYSLSHGTASKNFGNAKNTFFEGDCHAKKNFQ